IGRDEPMSPSRREAQLIYLTTSVEPLLRSGEPEKARLRLSEARRLASGMRHTGMEIEERLLLKVEAIWLYATGRRGEALERAQKQLALLTGRTDPVLGANFGSVELGGRIRPYAAGFDDAACTSATDRLEGIWNDLRAAYPHSSLVKAQ